MKASKALYSTYFEEYKLDEIKLKKLQQELLLMFLDFKNCCDKYNIDYMLCGGSCLGAIRHKGFIPWDDDIDIMMLRSEYEKFAEAFIKDYSDKYILAEPLKVEKFYCKMPKIYKKGTTYIELPNVGVNGPNMIFIDVFIIENMPKSKIKRQMLGKVYDLAFKGASTCIDYLYPSSIIQEKAKEHDEINKYYNLRRRIGWFFSHFGGIDFWLKKCEKIAKKYNNKDTKILGVPSGISYNREVFEEKIYKEITTTDFCGYEAKIPKYYDEYLTNLYGDYMQIPPKEKREIHVAYKVEI